MNSALPLLPRPTGRSARIVARLRRFGFLALSCIAAPLAWPCTALCLAKGERVLVGNNYDFSCVEGRVTVNRRGLRKTAFGTNSGLQWISRYGSITIGQWGHEFPNGGLNEAGLVVQQTMLESTRYPSDARPSISELQWVQYQLDCSATVDDVLASDALVRISTNSIRLHYLVADASGRAAVIEFIDGRTVVHTGSSLPVAVSTNDTYDASIAYAAAKSPSQTDRVSSLGRFVHAAASVRSFAQSYADPVSYAFTALENVRQPDCTLWNVVYDITNRTVYFRSRVARWIKQVRFADVDFRPSAPTRMINLNVDTYGIVVPNQLYSYADNLALMTLVFRQTPYMTGKAGNLPLRAAYPDTVQIVPSPVIAAAAAAQSTAAGGSITLDVTATGDAPLTYAWCRNGTTVANATAPTLTLSNMQPASAGLYTARATNPGGTTTSRPSIAGLNSVVKVLGSAEEVRRDIRHPNGNIMDQVLLAGAAASITADPGQMTRMSYVDLNDDIVQVEFSGPGTLSLVLDASSGPAAPINYHQPDVTYMRGHAGIVVVGATQDTHLSVFSVGRANAFDPTGAYDFLQSVSDTNNPANNGSPLFVGHASTRYDGIADVAFVAIASADGKFGGLRAANASFWHTHGFTGVYAPGVHFTGPVNVGNIDAREQASPVLIIGAADGGVRITGGDLEQENGSAVEVGGIARLLFTAGTTSHAVSLPAQANKGRLATDGVDVTAQLIGEP